MNRRFPVVGLLLLACALSACGPKVQRPTILAESIPVASPARSTRCQLSVSSVTAGALDSVNALTPEQIATWINQDPENRRPLPDGVRPTREFRLSLYSQPPGGPLSGVANPFVRAMIEEVQLAQRAGSPGAAAQLLSAPTSQVLKALGTDPQSSNFKSFNPAELERNWIRVDSACTAEIAAAMRSIGWCSLAAGVSNQPGGRVVLLNAEPVGSLMAGREQRSRIFILQSPGSPHHLTGAFATLSVDLHSPDGLPSIRWFRDILVKPGASVTQNMAVSATPSPSIGVSAARPLEPNAVYAGDTVQLRTNETAGVTTWFILDRPRDRSIEQFQRRVEMLQRIQELLEESDAGDGQAEGGGKGGDRSGSRTAAERSRELARLKNEFLTAELSARIGDSIVAGDREIDLANENANDWETVFDLGLVSEVAARFDRVVEALKAKESDSDLSQVWQQWLDTSDLGPGGRRMSFAGLPVWLRLRFESEKSELVLLGRGAECVWMPESESRDVTLISVNRSADGWWGMATRSFQVLDVRPRVIITLTPERTPVGGDVVVRVSEEASRIPLMSVRSCSLTWEDGGSETAMNPSADGTSWTASRTFTSPGVFEATVTVVDSLGLRRAVKVNAQIAPN